MEERLAKGSLGPRSMLLDDRSTHVGMGMVKCERQGFLLALQLIEHAENVDMGPSMRPDAAKPSNCDKTARKRRFKLRIASCCIQGSHRRSDTAV